jgi:hypothetical protein
MKEGSTAYEKQRRASVDKGSEDGGDGTPVTGYVPIFTFVCDYGYRC